jgi:hypothetical protein
MSFRIRAKATSDIGQRYGAPNIVRAAMNIIR